MPHPSARRLVFPAKQSVLLEDVPLSPVGPGQVRVRAHCSLMSTGTENIVFNRLFDPGTHWDNWVKYPFYPGYAAVGTVEEAGEGSPLAPGRRVAYRTGHASHSVLAAADCQPIPDGLPFEKAVWFSLAKIAFHGALAAQHTLGDTVLVIGAGPIGQMSVRWAAAAGAARIAAVDMVPGRLELARTGGAGAVIAKPIAEAGEEVGRAFAGFGSGKPRAVIDGTGNAAVFSAALGLAADRGRVVVLGDTGSPAKQGLTLDVITRGLTIVGAHDGHNSAEWNGATIPRLFFALASSGRFPLDGLTSHRFAPEACAEAYATANRDRASTMGILFEWEKE